MVLTSRPLESCHHQCLRAVCGGLGYPQGSALELLDGTLKLRHCTDVFYQAFSPPGLSPGVVCWVVRGISLLLIPWEQVVTWAKGSGLPRRHVQVILFMVFRTRGIQPRGDGKDCAPLPPKEWGGGRTSQSFSSSWGWMILHLGTPGTCSRGYRRRGFRLVSPAEGTSALAPVRFNSLHACARIVRDTCVIP